jgi:lysophospholipase L1-like esterase
MIAGMEERGIDHAALLDLYISTYNNCLRDKPADMTAGLHLCRGNFKVRVFSTSPMLIPDSQIQDGVHFSEGGYDRIAVKLFNNINVEVYYVRSLLHFLSGFIF